MADRESPLLGCRGRSRIATLQTQYGVSLCVRLLALIDLLSESQVGQPRLLAIEAGFARLHPALLRLARGRTPCMPDARFDEAFFRTNTRHPANIRRFRSHRMTRLPLFSAAALAGLLATAQAARASPSN